MVENKKQQDPAAAEISVSPVGQKSGRTRRPRQQNHPQAQQPAGTPAPAKRPVGRPPKRAAAPSGSAPAQKAQQPQQQAQAQQTPQTQQRRRPGRPAGTQRRSAPPARPSYLSAVPRRTPAPGIPAAVPGAPAAAPRMPAGLSEDLRNRVISPAMAANMAAAGYAAKQAAKRAETAVPGRQGKSSLPAPVLRVIPLGGLGEVGKNMTVYECNGDMFVVDCGSMFPDSEMFGIDLVIPDISYLIANKSRLRGIMITHGHEDHIGALPYFLRQLNVPVYATRLTCGLIRNKLEEFKLDSSVNLIEIMPGQTITFGCMRVTGIRVNHSIPDSVAFAIETPAGTVIHTGDFKVDLTPVTDQTIDLATFAEYGRRGVLALLADSTNSERPGFSNSERTVGQSFMNLFTRAEGKRIIIATFASNLQRIQQIINMAVKYHRKLAISGRSMVSNVTMAFELGYLHAPENIVIDIESIHAYKPEDLVIITTGSQGEPMSALSRMAGGTHRNVNVGKGDFIIISARPIPGNEKMVNKVVNSLMRLGADVIYESMYDVHTSGHAYQEEQKLMISLLRPKYFIPVHGEYKHLIKHAQTAAGCGVLQSNIVIADIGDVISVSRDRIGITDTVPSGRVLVDGLGVGDVGSSVLRDRRHLSQDGLLVVVTAIDAAKGRITAGPEVISAGFVYMKEAETLISDVKEVTCRTIERNFQFGGRRGIEDLQSAVRDQLSTLLYRSTKRSPMILPVIQIV